MPTSKQLRANRANAQHSAGPSSAEGTARSSGNALKSGVHALSELLPWEDPAELETLRTEYHDHYQPRTPDERRLVDNLVHGEFLSRRLHRAEVKIIVSKLPAGADPNDGTVIGKAWCDAGAELGRLQRRIDANDRAFHRNLKEFLLIQAVRPTPFYPQPNLQKQQAKPHKWSHFVKFLIIYLTQARFKHHNRLWCAKKELGRAERLSLVERLGGLCLACC